MSYTGVGITYRADKLPDGGQPGDILILDPNGNPAWLTPGGGGGVSSGLHAVLLLGNSAGDLGMQEVSRISGVFGGGGGHVGYMDLLPSTTNGGHLALHGGVSSDGHTASSLTVAGGLTGIAGGDMVLNGGNHANLNTGAHVELRGGRINEGGDISLFAGHTENGTGAGGSINLLSGDSQVGATGAQLFLSGAANQGALVTMRGGANLAGSLGATLSLGGGGTGIGLEGELAGGGGDFRIEAGNSAGGLPGGEGQIHGGASASGLQGGYIYLNGGLDLTGTAGGASLFGGNTTDGRNGGSVRPLGGTVGGSGGQVTVNAGAIDGAAQGSTLILSGANATSGGQTQLKGGNSLGTGGSTGAFLQCAGGAVAGAGGSAGIFSGAAKAATNTNGGDITLSAGAGDGTGRRGLLVVPNLPLAVPASPVSGAVWRTPQGFLTMHPHFCVNWPITFKSVDYTFAIDDGGKMFAHSGDVTARTWTIPSNASVALAPGTAIFLVNHNGAGVITIAITTDVMLLAGVGVKTTIAIAPSGEATLVKIDSTKWIVKGSGLTGLP